MAYQVIARKWRPQTFADVVGQRHVTQTLENAIKSNRVAHAYIFAGVRGVGKTTTARILAKAMNCVKGPTVTPCNECDSCREITLGSSLDVLEIDAASNRGIDQIRELREMVRYAALGRYKIVILDEAHQLTDEASNALLKTLEEPPEKVIFILATTQPEDLADTIKSRAQLFQFRALTFQEISDAIERIAKAENLKIDSGAVAVMARAAEGSLRDSLSLLEQALAYSGDHITDAQVRELLGVVAEDILDQLIVAIHGQSAERALALVHRLIAEGHNLQHFCREAIRHVRNLLVARVCGEKSELITAPADERPRLAEPLEEVIAGMREGGAPRATAPAKSFAATASAAPSSPIASRAASTPMPTTPSTTQERGPRYSIPTGVAGASSRSNVPEPMAARSTPAAALPPRVVASSIETQMSGLAAAQYEAIKAALQDQKFLSSMVEYVTRWELEGNEIRLFFPVDKRTLAEMLQARDPMERLRTVTSEVIGQPLRVCVKLEPARVGMARGSDLQARFEQDPIVRAMLERFGGRISGVKRRSEE